MKVLFCTKRPCIKRNYVWTPLYKTPLYTSSEVPWLEEFPLEKESARFSLELQFLRYGEKGWYACHHDSADDDRGVPVPRSKEVGIWWFGYCDPLGQK